MAIQAMIETTELTYIERRIKDCGGYSCCAINCNGLKFENLS